MTLTPSPITNVVKFVECCTGTEIFFIGSLPIVNGTTYLYTGLTPFPGTGGTVMPGVCYTLYNLYIPDIFYPPAPSIGDLSITSIDLGCEDPKCPSCDPPVKLPCYMVIPCDGTDPVVSNNIAFASLVGTFVNVITSTYSGCAYIAELSGNNCENAVDVAVISPCKSCELKCYFIDNSNGVLYVDADNVLQEISLLDAKPYVKICSRVYPVVDTSSQDYLIVDLGPCDEDGCPQKCYKLTNCETLQVIYTNSDSVLPYLYSPNSTVKILGKEGCWVVSNLADKEICDCPIDVTIVSSYIDCPTCLGVTAYKLTGCNSNDVIYTLDDLALYVGRIIKIDCGCYSVEQIDILPPNVQIVIVEDVYDTCIECTRIYWELLNCVQGQASIITYSDLSLYEDKVVKIEGCTECFTVKATNEHLNPALVTVSTVYDEGCVECLNDLPCICSVLTNYTIEAKTYVYIDCNNIRTVITLQSGESSDRICVKYWDTAFESTDILQTFGNCQNGLCPPPVFKNNRTVRPGYNTPICSPEKYDAITCRFADAMYRLVLEKRYGITNCCAEDNENAIVQKELIDLQALKDPNYNCPDCPCSCNSGKTCSTCNCGNKFVYYK